MTTYYSIFSDTHWSIKKSFLRRFDFVSVLIFYSTKNEYVRELQKITDNSSFAHVEPNPSVFDRALDTSLFDCLSRI